MRFLELKILPVVVVAVAALAMWWVAWMLPTWTFVFPERGVLAVVLVFVGGLISAAGVVAFRRIKTTVNPIKPETSSSLVASGIYGYSRNPMYLGFAVVLLGWAVFLANPAALVVLPLFILYMNRFQIIPEERALKSLFGAAFDRYREQVRRWI